MNNFAYGFVHQITISNQSKNPGKGSAVSISKLNMPTVLHIANELTHQFIRSKNKRHCAKHIVIELNSLHYPHSKKPIEYSLKAAIINLIEENLFGKIEDCIAFSEVKIYILENLYKTDKKEKISFNPKNNLHSILRKYKNIFLRRRPSF